MSLSNGYQDTAALSDRAMKSLSLPLGLANPLWLAFGAAASAGATWWLMTRWARPTHLEAAAIEVAPSTVHVAEPEPQPEPVSEPILLAAAETAATEAPAVLPPDLREEPAVEAVAEALPAPEPVVDSVAARTADDLTRLMGVGPRTAAALAARGVTRFAELAAWTADELAAFDAEMSLKGRSLRNGWLEQAKRLAAEA